MTFSRALVVAASLAQSAAVARADSSPAGDAAEAESPLLTAMRERVSDVKVSVVEEGGLREVSRVDHPLFRYSDEEREIFDATLWLWTDAGRPVALEKEEAAASLGETKWTVCFASLASGKVDVRWPRESRGFQTTTAGCEFEPLPGGPQPATQERQIRSQIRGLSKRFSVTCRYEGRGKTVSRLLSRPIHEYSAEEHGVIAGAIFGFAAYGTNPDSYVLIELRKTPAGTQWVYGCARMTIFGVDVSLDEKTVWSCEELKPIPGYFDRWAFFFEPRPEAGTGS